MTEEDIVRRWRTIVIPYLGEENLFYTPQESFSHKVNNVKSCTGSQRIQALIAINLIKSSPLWDEIQNHTLKDAIHTCEEIIDGFVNPLIMAGKLQSVSYNHISPNIKNPGKYINAVYATARSCTESSPHALIRLIDVLISDLAGLDREIEINRQTQIVIQLTRPEWTFNSNWQTQTTNTLAQIIYDKCRYDLTPILADALEDNHCDNHHLLNYLRKTKKIPKGDWVIDNLLNKR